MKLVANSERSFGEAVVELRKLWDAKKYLRITATTNKERSIDQNALWAALYERISISIGDGTAEDIARHRSYCKLMIGVPIMRRDCPQFEAGWQRYFAKRSYEEQLYVMGNNALFGVDGFPVTRLFDTKQGAEYTEAIPMHFISNGNYIYFDDLLDGKHRRNGHGKRG